MTQRRLLYVGGPVYYRFIAGYIILAIGCTLGLYFSWRAQQDARREGQIRCRNEALDRIAIRQSLLISRDRIQHLSYYRSHRKEQSQALADTDAALARFPPVHC